MPRIEFEAETLDELVEMARRWVGGAAAPGEPPRTAAPGPTGPVDFAKILGAIRGPDSRRLVGELAKRAIEGRGLTLDEELRKRYGKTTGTAFAGIVAGPNKVMRRIAGRDLILWNAEVSGYRMRPDDAKAVLEVMGPVLREPPWRRAREPRA
jgi:hypothetical protein